MRAMQVVKVGFDEWDRPLLLLRESAGQGRILPVWIGEAEAGAIAPSWTSAELDLDHGTLVSARVSDAVAVALHLRVPIWAEDTVLDQAGVNAVDPYWHDCDSPGEANRIDEREVARLQEFLETASPEDFNPS